MSLTKVSYSMITGAVVNALDFGATGDGTTDDVTALQNAIDYCITNQKRLFIPVGTYKITSPLIIGKWSGSAWSYASLEIEGEKLAYAVQQTNASFTNIVPTYVNTFAIGIQNGRGVKISNVYILGKNDTSSTIYTGANMMTNSNWVINSCRDSRYSPYAGIVVDPFGTSVPSDGGYPGLSSYYVASAAGSAQLEFSDVAIKGFVAGIALCPNGTTANCSEIAMFNCYIVFNKVGVSMGQSQSRNVTWNSGSCGPNLYCFDGNTYGAQTGYAPAIYGCNMSGKYLFNITSRYGNALPVSGIHAETFSSIGFYGTGNTSARYPLTFVDCEFNFYDFGTGAQPDYHLLTYADVDFIGCFFNNQSDTYSGVLRFVYLLLSKIVFTNCNFGASVQSEFFLSPAVNGGGYNSWNDIYFKNSSFSDNSSRGNTQGNSQVSHEVVSIAPSYVDRSVFPNGSKIKWTASGAAGDLQLVGGLETDYQIALGSLSVTVGSNNTATFTVSDGTIVRTGDLVYSRTAFNTEGPAGTVTLSSVWLCLGIVSNVSTNLVTISGCPQNFASGTYTLSSQWWPRYHQASTGDTSTSTSIANVTNVSSWVIGNKIMGSGIPVGTYITNVSGTTLTLSKATTTSVSGTRLYDANVQKFTGSAV